MKTLTTGKFHDGFLLMIIIGITNLWITPEPARANQNHPGLARATQESPRASQSMLDPTRARREPMKI